MGSSGSLHPGLFILANFIIPLQLVASGLSRTFFCQKKRPAKGGALLSLGDHGRADLFLAFCGESAYGMIGLSGQVRKPVPATGRINPTPTI
jgi:hypothetical protein